jgi:hypothetical protein
VKKLIRVLEPVHMGLGHDGLAKLLKEQHKIDVTKLEEGALIACINKAKNRLKLLGAQGQVLGYLKLHGERRIHMDALRFIPQTFGAKGLDYDAALAKSLRMSLGTQLTEVKVPA